MKSIHLPFKLLLLVILTFILITCKIALNPNFRQVYTDYNTFIHNDSTEQAFLKVHHKNGYVSIFDNWELNQAEDSLLGNGKLFSVHRNQLNDGKIAVDLNQVAIIETNQLSAIQDRYKPRLSRLSILMGVDAIIGAICVSVPKACFGSCPTFYINDNQNVHFSNAEGFSSCISPSLEKRDIDALNFQTNDNRFKITMKNEAIETHAVNQINLIAAEVETGKSIFHGVDDRFYQCAEIINCTSAKAEKGPINKEINTIDDDEYFSLTDSLDLGKREEIILEFDEILNDSVGLVLNFRQTLLTTFLLYNGLSYMGDEVGDYFAKIETSNLIRKKLGNPFNKLGGIRVSYFDDQKKKWIFANEIYETGPIAKNLQLVPLNFIENKNNFKVKIEMTKGLWRLDYLALAKIDKEVKPYFITSSEIINDNLVSENALTEVECDDENYLISVPGDNFDILFNLPEKDKPNNNFELFLSVKGYYLEWMRKDWLQDKNTAKLEKMLLNDKETWRDLAMEYKIYESQMEEIFWNSKYSNTQ